MTSLLRWPRRESLLSDAGRQRRMAGQTTARAARPPGPPHWHSRNHWVGGSRGFFILMRSAPTVPITPPITTAGSARRPKTIKMPAAAPDAGQNTAKFPRRRDQAVLPEDGDGARRTERSYPPARQPYRVGLPPSKLPREVATGSLFSERVLYSLRSLPYAVCANSINSAPMFVCVYIPRRQSGVSARAIRQRGNGNREQTVLDREIHTRRLCRR